MFHSLPHVSIVVSSSVVLLLDGVQVFSFYLKMLRAKQFASKPKFRGNKYVRVNKGTGTSEKRQPRCIQRGESSCVKHNPTASSKIYI
jgi:hypothetical protein